MNVNVKRTQLLGFQGNDIKLIAGESDADKPREVLLT